MIHVVTNIMYCKLWKSVCNTIHHYLEHMGSAFRDLVLIYVQVSDVLCYKPIPIIYRTSLLQNSLKVIIIYCTYNNNISSPLPLFLSTCVKNLSNISTVSNKPTIKTRKYKLWFHKM